MNRRIVGLIGALALALVGTAALVFYVGTAEQRALAGERLVEVYVVDQPIAAGTAVEQIGPLVSVERVPIKVAAAGAVQDLAVVAGLVVALDLVPGEQLVTSRFVARAAMNDRQIGIDVPDEMVEITVELAAERAVGGLLEPGQTVSVLASFEPFSLSRTVVDVNGEAVPLPSSVGEDVQGTTPNSTDLLLRKVLVTAIQEPIGSRPAEGERLTDAPEDSVFVTLAVEPFDAERLVFTAEFGEIWLAAERESVPESDEPGQTRGSVLIDRRPRR